MRRANFGLSATLVGKLIGREFLGKRCQRATAFTLLLLPACTTLDAEVRPATLGAMCAPTTPAPTEGGAHPLGSQIDRRLQASSPSGSFLFVRQGEVVLRKSYGTISAGGPAITADTVFMIASLSKSFTAAAILRLKEEGRLKLTDRIDRFFPGAPPATAGITIHQLLTHTAGLPREVLEDQEVVDRDTVVARVLHAPLKSPPGSRRAYSNGGFMLLGAIIEKASRMSFDAYLERAIIQPAGLQDTGFPSRRKYAGTRVAQQINTPGFTTPLDEPASRGWYRRGSGALLSTVRDLERWQNALRCGRVLSPQSVALLFSPAVVFAPGDTAYTGYGWVIERGPAGPVWWHNGQWGAYYAEIRMYPQVDSLAIVVSNRADRALEAAWEATTQMLVAEQSAPSS